MNRHAWILFGLMGAIWGVPYLFIKVAVEHMSPPVVVFGRTSIAVVPLLIVATRAGAIRPALACWRPLLAFATLEMAIPWFLLTDAERHLPSGLTGLLIACVPIVGAVVAYLLGDHHALAPRRLAGIALGLSGVTLLVAADLSGEAPWWSIVEVLLVCVGYATAPFIASRRLADVPDVGVVALSLSAVAIVYAPDRVGDLAGRDAAGPRDPRRRGPRHPVHGHRVRRLLPAHRRRRPGALDADHVHQPGRRRGRRRDLPRRGDHGHDARRVRARPRRVLAGDAPRPRGRPRITGRRVPADVPT